MAVGDGGGEADAGRFWPCWGAEGGGISTTSGSAGGEGGGGGGMRIAVGGIGGVLPESSIEFCKELLKITSVSASKVFAPPK